MVPPRASIAGSHDLGTHRFAGHLPGCAWEYLSLRTDGGAPVLWCRSPAGYLHELFVLIDRPRPTPELVHLVTASPYGVVVYQGDVALFRRGADTSANRPLARWLLGEVRDAMSLPRQVGSVMGDAASRPGRAVRAPRGEAGLVAYGWYVWACPAPHELVVRIRGDARWRPGSPGRVEIAGDLGERVLAARTLDEVPLDRADYRELVLPVTVPKAGWIETRVYSTGNAAFWVDSMALVGVTPSGAFQPPGESCGKPPGDQPSPAAPTASLPERTAPAGRHS
jgi:hypothetical protein